MEDSLKFIYQNFGKAKKTELFSDYWYVFENYLDRDFPHSGKNDNMLKRLQRFEEDLELLLLHPLFLSRTFALEQASLLAELQPLIFRELSGDTSVHIAFSSDYSRYVRGQKPKEPISRLLNLLYTIRCNDQHGQKILPEEWEQMRTRNELIFSLTTPLLSMLDELILTFFVTTGIFAYGTLHHFGTTGGSSFVVTTLPGMKIKGHLYDLGEFPGWRYETWGWVHGEILKAPLQFRDKFVQQCDTLEGNSFERRLVVVYKENEDGDYLAWAYHYNGETNISKRIKGGIWQGSNN